MLLKKNAALIGGKQIRITKKTQQQNNNNQDRLLISLGFGANNIFTKEFEKGTIHRQHDQNKSIIGLLNKNRFLL
jgi:hypothetical protein